MLTCTKHTDDPLLKQFLNMGINLFTFPRLESPVGQVYVVRPGSDVRQEIWQAENVFSPKLPDLEISEVKTPRSLQLETTSTGRLDQGLAASVIASQLPDLPEGSAAKIASTLKRNSVFSATLKLAGLRAFRLPVDEIQIALRDRDLTDHVERIAAGKKLYLATGAWSAFGLEIAAMDSAGSLVDLSAEFADIVKAAADLSITLQSEGQSMFKSKKRLFFGVELMEIKRRDGALFLDSYRPEKRLAGENDAVYDDALASIWGPDDIIEFDPKPIPID